MVPAFHDALEVSRPHPSNGSSSGESATYDPCEPERPDVIVVGGGAIGVCCALELARRGAQVTLLERGPSLASGCSAGNAGLVCPSHSVPISNPTSLRNGLRWMWKRDSPVLPPPAPGRAALARALRARRAPLGGTAPARSGRSRSTSLELHAQLGEELGTSFERTGTLNVYETRGGVTHEADAADGGAPLRGARRGADARARAGADRARSSARSATRTRAASTRSGSSRRSGAPPPRPASRSAPASRCASLDELRGRDGRRRRRRLVAGARRPPARGRQGLPRRLRARRRTTRGSRRWVQETWTIATPLPDRLRLSGTFELAGLDLSVSQSRVDTIRRGGDRWFRGLAGRPVLETWAGLRPCLPDGLPAIGRLAGVVVATGHAMKGVSLAPVTGRLVAQLVSGEEPDHDLAPVRPEPVLGLGRREPRPCRSAHA